MRLLLVRHGEPNYELDCLTPWGHKQADVAAYRLMEEGIDEIFSSPQGRAYETAEHFSKVAGIEKITKLDFIREIRYGHEDALYDESLNPWMGVKKMISDGENMNVPDWREKELFTDNTATVDVDKIAVETDKWLKTLGYEREGLFYRRVSDEYADKTVVIFCHGGASTAFLSRVLNLPFPYLCAFLFHIDHTAITRLYFESRNDSLFMPIVELASDASHLKRACIERVKDYERRMDEATFLLKKKSLSEDEAEILKEHIMQIEDYLSSEEWKRDHARDEAGRLPKDIKRGVLSEDGIYNLLDSYKTEGIRIR